MASPAVGTAPATAVAEVVAVDAGRSERGGGGGSGRGIRAVATGL